VPFISHVSDRALWGGPKRLGTGEATPSTPPFKLTSGATRNTGIRRVITLTRWRWT
jgi:hypothetical protein